MTPGSEERRLLAILVADIVGYSGLMARFESETFQRIKELQSSLMLPAVARNKGVIVKYTGDGFIATFASALDAVRTSVEVQSGARAAAATASEDRRIMFRIGINVGDVIVVPGDIYGDSVNIAARLQGLAKPGGICVSRAVRDTVKGKFEIDFKDLGNVNVKNIPDPVGTYELDYQVIAWAMERKRPETVATTLLRRARPPLLAGAVLGIVVAAAVGAWFWAQATVPPQSPPAAAVVQALPAAAADMAQPSFTQSLDERITRMAPDMPESMRAFHRSSYLQMAQMWQHRAIAVAPELNVAWRVPSNASASNAEERALEGCQLRFGQPCAILAVNDALAPANRPPWPLRDMSRVGYVGRFDPSKIPAVAIPVRSRPDVVGYQSATGPKAIAIHPLGLLHVVAMAGSQFVAEQRALDACKADPTHEGRNLPCYLYAIGDDVVLPRRASAPLSAPVAVPVPDPAATISSPSQSAPTSAPSALPTPRQ